MLPLSENKKLRAKIDENLLDDFLGILGQTKVLEVTGSLEKRVERVLELELA